MNRAGVNRAGVNLFDYLYFVEKTCKSGIKTLKTERFCIIKMGVFIIVDRRCNIGG